MGYPERIVPDETEPGVVALHTVRYDFALPFCAGKEVLDAGCGVGYGTALLAERAARVVGVDLDPDAIDYARRRYPARNVEFRVGDLLALDLADASFDVVCSFEAIEHLDDQERYLDEMGRVLRPDGLCFVSTPRVDRTTRSPANPFHRVELSRADFQALLESRFERVELYGQRRVETRRHKLVKRLDVLGLRRRVPALRRASALTGSRPTTDLTAADVVIVPERLDEATELVAVAREPRQ